MDRDEDFEEDGFAVVAPPAALKKAKSSSSKSASSTSSSARPKAKKPQTQSQPQPVKKKAPSKKAVSSAGKKPAKSSADDVDMVAASDSGSSSDDAPLSKLKSNSIAKAKQTKEKAAAKPTKPKPKAVKPKAKAIEAAATTSAPTAAAAKKKSKPKPKSKAKVEASAPAASRSPSPARRPTGGMLSVFELCNTDDDGNGNDGRRADRDVEDGDDEDDDDEEDNASTIGSEAGRRGGVPIDVDADDEEEDGDEEETTSTVDGDDASDQDEGWSDHNRWYCNICKDGGELLCCDRCPRAFHMSCLGMGETAIPDTEWFCKMCSECLDRRRAKSEKKEKARLLREAEKLERDAKKLQLKQQKEEMIAKKSVDAIENKAKRVLEMQDRILSRKKIKYKDKEEEKLGKLAEDLAQTVRDAKEKLEKLEKEDASLKKKEEALNKKKKGIDDLPDDIDSASRSDKPIPQECNFGALPSKHIGAVLAVWDSISSFSKILNLSPISVEQFGSALAHQEHSALMTEIHMCLLDLIMEDREDEDYMSDDESAMDERERYRYEVQHAPLTVGVPTLTMLNSLSWPSVLHSLIVAVPRYTAHATANFREAVNALYSTEYPKLSVRHKLSLLNFLVRRAFGTEKIRQMLGKHLGETIQASKEFNRAVLQDRKVALEDEKKLREKQKAELAGLVEKRKTSVKTWLKPDSKKNASNGNADTADENEDDAQSDSGAPGSASDSDLDDLAYNEEALAKNEEELERLQMEDRISRHEYLSRKKNLEVQRERLRKKAEEKLRKQRMQEQMERKRTAAKKGIQEGLLSKDASLLRVAIEKGKECSLPERIIVSATHVLEILEAEAVREEEADTRKRKFNEMIRSSFVRTEPLGRDRNQCRYWILQGDKQRLYIEKPGSSEKLKLKYETMENGGSVKSESDMDGEGDGAIWYCYSSEAEVIALVDSLDTRITREAQLKTALTENFDLITADMPMSKPGLLISDLLNEDSANGKKRQRKGNGAANSVPTDFSVWRNERKTWRKKPHAVVDVDSFRDDLIEVEAWLSKRLKDYGSNWQERAPGGHVDWLKNVKSVVKIAEFVAPLLALETEVMSFQLKAQGLPAAPTNGAQETSKTGGESNRTGDNDKSDDEDEDEDELDALADDGSILWPTTHCRNRWIEEVKKAKTIATLAVALASFEQRLDVFGLAEAPNEDQGVSTRRAKSEKEKRSRKERAAKKNQSKEESEEISSMRDSNDEWEEDCYICSEGGELLCCDGCPRVFHYTCAGLRRIPRGKTFCHVCDASVKPIFPVAKTTRSSVDARKDKDAQAGASDARTASSNGGNASKEASDHIHPASGGKPQMTTRSSEDQWDVDCSVCALGGELLCCDGCPRAFHVACIGMEKIPDDEWFCNECNLQTCGACKKNKIRLDSHVICGSEDGTKGCERVFHLKCAKLSAVPEDDWFCKKCRSSFQK